MERNFLKEMLSQPFYNEKRIPGYNHATGQLDSKQMPAKSINEKAQLLLDFFDRQSAGIR